MSKSIALLLVLVFLTASCLIAFNPVSAASPNSWTSKAPMQVARGGLGVAVVNGKIYAIGGSTESGKWPVTNGFVGTNEEYDSSTDTWTFKKPMTTPRYGLAIAVYQNKIYCIGGVTGYSTSTGRSFTGVNEVYDPITDTWETRASMPTARWLLQANVVNGKIYLIGGQKDGAITGVNEVYDPVADSWTTKAPMPTEAESYASVAIDDKIYVVGGFSNAPLFWSNLNQIYDPETDKWRLGASALSSIVFGDAGETAGVMALSRIYDMGVDAYNGLGVPPCLNRVYDPEKDAWTAGADVPTNRLEFGVAVVNDKLYAIGGYVYNVLGFVAPSAANEQYTPLGYGTVPPVIFVASPENVNYTSSEVPLNFTVDRHVEWMGYSLDGNENVTVTGNTTLTGLSTGLHNVTVYAKDEFENTGVSETISFSVEEPFPTAIVAAASAVSVAAVGVGLLVYFKKRNR